MFALSPALLYTNLYKHVYHPPDTLRILSFFFKFCSIKCLITVHVWVKNEKKSPMCTVIRNNVNNKMITVIILQLSGATFSSHFHSHTSSKCVWMRTSPFRPCVKKKVFQLHRQYTAALYSLRGSERRRGNWNRQYFSTGAQASPSARMCKG